MSLRTLPRLCAVPLALGVVVLGVAAPASAHVEITATTTAAGANTVLTVNVPHGCDGSPTTKIAIQIPKEINEVTPTRNALWNVTKQTEKLDPPVTAEDGDEITERTATVVYTAKTPLPDGYRDAFELSLQLPDAEGTTLTFPTIQTCEKGESAWIEVPEAGQSEEDLELPAPSVTITAAEGDSETADEPPSLTADQETSEDRDALSAWALGAGILGIALGAAALLQGRRRR
jgi:uncharacterized protein YcnI